MEAQSCKVIFPRYTVNRWLNPNLQPAVSRTCSVSWKLCSCSQACRHFPQPHVFLIVKMGSRNMHTFPLNSFNHLFLCAESSSLFPTLHLLQYFLFLFLAEGEVGRYFSSPPSVLSCRLVFPRVTHAHQV